MTDMNRIEARMNACSKKQEKAFITYITAGLPDLAATKEIIRAQERGGSSTVYRPWVSRGREQSSIRR